VTAVAILLVGLFYRRAFGSLRRRQWLTLLALRVAAILIIVLMLFRPVFSYVKDLDERRSVIFLVDSSASMSISDDASGRSRYEQARRQVEKWWDRLSGSFDLHLIEFSERARALDDVKQLATLVPDGKATSLSRALVAAAKKVPRRDIEAIFLISDGVHNSARRPEEVAGKMGVTVHAVGVGASLRSDASYRDVQVTGLNCAETLMLNNKAQITASIEGIGLAGRVIRVVLEDDDQPVEEAELTLDEIEGMQEVRFELRPRTEGRHRYTVRAVPLAEEKIEENNQRSSVALVVEPGIRVLYVEGALRAEYGAMVERFLSKDPDLEFCSLVRIRANEFLKRSNIEGLDLKVIPEDQESVDKFDVLIIGDLDSSYIKPAQQEMFVRRVREGAGLLMLGGYHGLGPGGYAGTPIGEILPLRLGSREVGQVTAPFLPQLTPEGTRHPIFANIATFFPPNVNTEQTSLPPLDGCTRVEGRQPGATVLATCPLETSAEGEMPVLAVQPVGEGRTAVFCGDTTRKWQQTLRALDLDSPFLQFWGQMIRWLAGRSSEVEAEAGVVVSSDKGYYEPEEEIRVSAVVRDQEGKGADRAKVTAKIDGPGGESGEIELLPVPDSPGRYGGTYVPEAPGRYEIAVQARLAGMTLEPEARLVVEVGRPNLEFEHLDLDEKLLGRIAGETGGRYVHVSTADPLVDQLDRTQRKKRVRLEQPLCLPLPLWTLFVVVITSEWILRRRFQLR
jgi:uncharacterized membrane protein